MIAKFNKNVKKKVSLLGLAVVLVGAVAVVLWANAKPVGAVPWASTMANWEKREQLTLVNNSGQTLNAKTRIERSRS